MEQKKKVTKEQALAKFTETLPETNYIIVPKSVQEDAKKGEK